MNRCILSWNVTTDDLFTSGKCELSLDEIDVTGRIRRQIIMRSMKYPEKLSEWLC